MGVVALTETVPANVMSRVDWWVHQRWPHLVDCRPIDVAGAVRAAGFATVQVASTDMWMLPVAVVVGEQTSRAAR